MPFRSTLLAHTFRNMSTSRPIESVWDYPRPPALHETNRLLEVIWCSADGKETPIARTSEGYRVLETSHPPTYYLPPSSILPEVHLTTEPKQSFCEWKGVAAYHTLTIPSLPGSPSVSSRIWSYPSPTSSFKPITGFLSFYASSSSRGSTASDGHWKALVDGEVVKAQDGDFYGGWMTSDISGGKRGVKGGPGTWGW